MDWKILGPDVQDVDYVAWQCDQDAYAAGGQKCSATSLMFAHENWEKAGIFDKMATQAAKRSFSDLSISPVITWNNKRIADHIANCLKIPGAKLLFGGKVAEDQTIPDCYGSYVPTAVHVPLKEMANMKHWGTVNTELFGPFQVVTTYKDSEIDLVLEILERQTEHLTAGVVSNDIRFVNKVMANTVNGTSYAGIRARTTGAPQNHWFGPAGDPRGAGIGTPEAILVTWTCHREIVMDIGPVAENWTTPKPT